jgi:hypothetical protein
MKRMLILLVLVSLACQTSAAVTPTRSVPTAIRRAVSAPTPAPVGEWVVCRTPWLNVRNTPDRFGDVVSVKNEGEFVPVYEWREGWARIARAKWVNGKYLCK